MNDQKKPEQATPPALAPAAKTAATIKFEEGAGLLPSTFDEAWRMAQLFARSDLVPKDYRDKPENVLVAIQHGAEIGLKPLQAVQGIAVINGRPSIWGDALWALVTHSPLVVEAFESFDEATMTATCTIERRGRASPVLQKFSQKDAVLAGLWDKPGPWKQYPRRMLQMRARAFAARDALPDVLKGLAVAEEAGDVFDGMAREVTDRPNRRRPERIAAAPDNAEPAAS